MGEVAAGVKGALIVVGVAIVVLFLMGAIGSNFKTAGASVGGGFGGSWSGILQWVVPVGALVTFIVVGVVIASRVRK